MSESEEDNVKLEHYKFKEKILDIQNEIENVDINDGSSIEYLNELMQGNVDNV